MMDCKVQVVIIGAGPAGLAAAQILLRHGARILCIDENRSPGGQLLRHGRHTEFMHWPREVRSVQSFPSMDPSRCTVLWKAQLLGRDPDGTLWVVDRQGRNLGVQADILLIATGARERFVPFPGWALPGVLSTGAAQVMLKESGVLVDKDMLLAGSTPLLYALGSEILSSRGQVRAIVDQNGVRAGAGLLAAAARLRRPLGPAVVSMSRLIRGGVAVHRQRKILTARGDRELEEVVTVKLDRQGKHIAGSERISPVRTAAVGYGFIPNVELAAQAGCELKLDAHPGVWAVQVDGRMLTTIPGIYAAGEVTGIGGGGKALLEGQVTAWAILQDLGLIPKTEADRILKALSAKRRKWLVYGLAVHRYCRPPGQSLWDLPDDTLICRCENVTLAEIKRGIERGFTTPGALKKATRSGMGMCQGRTCQPIVAELLAEHFPDGPVQPPSLRMPVKPVSVANMVRDHEPDQAEN